MGSSSLVTLNPYDEYTEILIDTDKGKKIEKQFGRFELVFFSKNKNSNVRSSLKTDTILMTIYTLKFDSDLPSF